MPYDMRPVEITPGVASTDDFTPQSVSQWTYTDKVRMVDGFPEKIGGWLALPISGIYSIQGVARTIFSYTLGNVAYYTIGTNTNLYSVTNNTLFNATPVDDGAADTLNNVLGTIYGLLGNNPLLAVTGINTVTVNDPGHPFLNGDSVLFSGAADTGGIPAAQINTTQTIQYIDADNYSFTVSSNATFTEYGGGAAVNRTCRLVTVQQTNSYTMGDNVVISDLAAPVGGIPFDDINGIRVVRNVTGSGYNILADAFANSSVTGVGGTVTITPQIPSGNANSTVGSGYGMGLYGAGLYGVAASATSPTLPRIWSMDRFGLLLIATPGTQTGLYQWNSSVSTLPELVTNAPTAINYTFTTDNIAVTLGADNTPQRIQWSDLGNLTVWAATAQNQAGLLDVEGASTFISHAAMQGFNLLFTETQVYSFRYIGPPYVFQIQLLDSGKGLIAQNARIVVNGIAYWMGNHNFYWYNGGNVDIIPSNTTNQSTIRKYVFNNLNWAQASKIFCYYSPDFNEIQWHYPSGTSTECNSVARFNILDRTWVPDTMDRTAAEYPTIQQLYPYLIGSNNTIYQHENGYDDDTEILPFVAYGPYFNSKSKRTVFLGGIYPDNIVTSGKITFGINFKRFPNSQHPGSSSYDYNTAGEFDSGFDSSFAITGDANLIYRKTARYWQYAVSGAVQGQFWRAGQWQELIMPSTGSR